jgi:predicted RNA-binding protein with RPS1 domain
MPFEIGETVPGRIIEINAQGLLVALPEGRTGVLPSRAPLTLEAMQLRFPPGKQLTVRVIAIETDGPLTLDLPPGETDAETPFDQEFHRLNHALTSTSVSPRLSRKARPAVEEEIEAWVGAAGQTLARLRKHRGERLSEQFYDDNE